MTLQTLLFSLSIIFQLSGAILLIILYFTNTKKKIAYEYFSFEGFVKQIENDMEQLKITEEKRLCDILGNIYINRAAFIYLVIGYALTVVGNNESENPYILMIILVLFGIFLSIATIKVINKIANRSETISKYSVISKEDIANGSVMSVIKEQK